MGSSPLVAVARLVAVCVSVDLYRMRGCLRVSMFTHAVDRCVAMYCDTPLLSCEAPCVRLLCMRPRGDARVPVDAMCTWLVADSIFVLLVKTDTGTMLNVPCHDLWFTMRSGCGLPTSVPSGVCVYAQYAEDLLGDGRVSPRLLLFDCCYDGNAVERYQALRMWCAEFTVHVVQWVGYASALRELVQQPDAFGIAHAIGGVVTLGNVHGTYETYQRPMTNDGI